MIAWVCACVVARRLEILLFVEEHAEADDGAVDEKTTNDGHNHGLDCNETGVGEDDRQGHAHDNKEAGKEAPQVKNSSAGALDKVIRVGAVAADPVGNGGDHIGGDDEQGVVDLPQGARENDEEKPDGEDEGEGDDGLEARGRHGGRLNGGTVCEDRRVCDVGEGGIRKRCWKVFLSSDDPRGGKRGKKARLEERRY